MTNENDNQNGVPGNTATAETVTPAVEKPRKSRGFAAMDPKLVSELAKRGGKAAHRAGTAHQFTSDEARVAGRKGGMATHAKRRERLPSGTSH
jgi:general stress protein YciG